MLSLGTGHPYQYADGCPLSVKRQNTGEMQLTRGGGDCHGHAVSWALCYGRLIRGVCMDKTCQRQGWYIDNRKHMWICDLVCKNNFPKNVCIVGAPGAALHLQQVAVEVGGDHQDTVADHVQAAAVEDEGEVLPGPGVGGRGRLTPRSPTTGGMGRVSAWLGKVNGVPRNIRSIT